MPESEKHWGGPVVIGGENLPSPIRVGLTDLQNIGGGGHHFDRDSKFVFCHNTCFQGLTR